MAFGQDMRDTAAQLPTQQLGLMLHMGCAATLMSSAHLVMDEYRESSASRAGAGDAGAWVQP